MPQENKKRGRRAEAQKRKLEAEAEDAAESPKRRKTDTAEEGQAGLGETEQQHGGAYELAAGSTEFYGLLDEEEQEYFRRADDMLEVNQFQDSEQRSLFLANVYKEADGKELKLASSQSCSRLMERLILLSSPEQLKTVFKKFSGHFLHLVQQRFASHCCETLFLRSAPIVTQDLLASPKEHSADGSNGEVFVAMEALFLSAIDELDGNLGYLMTDQFASHTLRVLLTVLSGQSLDSSASQSLLRSKRKEKVDVMRADKSEPVGVERRAVPDSFRTALEKMMSGVVVGLDTTSIRTLATHHTGNPMLQLLLQLECTHFGKSRAKDESSIIRKLLPDQQLAEGVQTVSFVQGLVYDPVGSRLLETIVEHAPGKMFKALYRECFRERIESMARNDIAGYVVTKIVERLSSEDLQTALDGILPQIPSLLERGRTALIRTLIERCTVRGLDTQSLATAIQKSYTSSDADTFSVLKMLQIPEESLNDTSTINGNNITNSANGLSDLPSTTPKPTSDPVTTIAITTSTPSQLHASILAQTMLRTPGPLSSLIFTALGALPSPTCLHLALLPHTSHVLQAALTASTATVIFRRKLTTRFYGHICALALHTCGSHVVDAIWDSTRHGMAFIRERVAEELAENEAPLRASRTGRKVWRNWRMDLYRARRVEWVRQCRRDAGNEGFLSFPGGAESRGARKGPDGAQDGKVPLVVPMWRRGRRRSARDEVYGRVDGVGADADVDATGRFKTKLDLARERYAAQAQGKKGVGVARTWEFT